MLAILQLSGICQDILRIGGLGLCYAAAALAVAQGTAGAVLQLALIVFQHTANGDGIANGDLGNAVSAALQAVAGNGHIFIAAYLDHNGNVTVCAVIGGFDLNDLTGEAGVVIQVLAVLQLGGIGHDGLYIGGLGLCYAAAAQAVQQSTAAAELQLALVVFDDTLNGDDITTGDLLNAIALQTVAGDGHMAVTVNADHNRDVAVSAVIGGLDIDDLTGQSCVVVQVLTPAQLGSVCHDLLGIRGGLLSLAAAADAVDHLTTGVKFDLALIVLDDTHNGDDIIHSNLVYTGTLHTVAGDGLLLCALDHHNNRDVVIVGIEGRVDLNDLTGQSCNIGQALAVLQRIRCLHDLQRIGRSVHSIALFNALQDTALVELDLALVVLDGAGDSNDIANLQVFHALALQTIALNGVLLVAFHHHGNGDVLVLGVIHGVDGGNLTGQSDLVGQAFAVSQCVGILQDLTHVHGLGQNAIPAISSAVAALVGDGGDQLIGSVLLACLIHIDGDHFAFTGNDLDLAVAAFDGPNHLKGLTAHANHAIALIIAGGLDCFVGALVERLQVFHCCICSNVLTNGGFCFCLLTAGKHAQNHNKQKNPCKNSFHSKLLILFNLTQ